MIDKGRTGAIGRGTVHRWCFMTVRAVQAECRSRRMAGITGRGGPATNIGVIHVVAKDTSRAGTVTGGKVSPALDIGCIQVKGPTVCPGRVSTRHMTILTTIGHTPLGHIEARVRSGAASGPMTGLTIKESGRSARISLGR